MVVFTLKLRGKVELDMLKVLLRHTEYIAGVSEEHVASLLILGHILVFAFLEVLQFLLVVALYPACLIEVDRFPTALGVILVFQTILDNLELQLTNGTDDLAVVELVDEQLGYTLVHQLVDTLLELFRLHGVVVLDILEQLWREGRQATEVKLFALRNRVTNFKQSPRIGQTYDITRPCLIDG